MNQSSVEIIGESKEIEDVIKTCHKIAKSSFLTTLISGENGTGKEVVARLIHNLSAVAEQPFIDINCGAIPEALLESELFGYEKGSFTGANNSKKGLFELANGGTIFLDEIGNTTSNLQIKLLKAVETKRFRRIGGVKEISILTRIIAASNVNLLEAVEAGKFREDLYYRLNIVQITVPPLRQRGNDIISLAKHFIDHFNREFGRDVKGMNNETIDLLKKYNWPGNVRQLKNTIERAVLVEADEWIEPENLMLEPNWGSKLITQETKSIENNLNIDFNKFDIPAEGISLEEIEKNLILSALEKANGNLSQTARLLKIQRGKLRYRLEKLGINN